MRISITCPHCNSDATIPQDVAGKTVRCPICKKNFTAFEVVEEDGQRDIGAPVDRACPHCQEIWPRAFVSQSPASMPFVFGALQLLVIACLLVGCMAPSLGCLVAGLYFQLLAIGLTGERVSWLRCTGCGGKIW